MARFFRRRFRGRRMRNVAHVTYTRNHFLQDFTQTTGGTEQQTTIATGVDDVSNRSTHIPDGSKLCRIALIGQAETVNAGGYTFAIFRVPGTETLTTPLANFFASTDPMTAETIKARKFRLAGPFRFIQPSAAVSPVRVNLKWKGRLTMRDGDDIVLAHNMPATNQVLDARIYTTYCK